MISLIKKNLDLENLDKLGVKEEHFLQNFEECPPGVLPLKCLSFFARRYKDQLRNLMINNSGKGENCFPLVRAAVHATMVVAIELQIVNAGNF